MKPTTEYSSREFARRSYIFRVSLFYFGPSAKIVYCFCGTLLPVELAEIILHPLVFGAIEEMYSGNHSIYFGFIDR